MVSFLTMDEITDLYKFVRVTLTEKYQQKIDIEEAQIVTGLSGSEIIEDAIKIVFIPAEAKVEWVEDKIGNDIHKYCYENDIRLIRSIVIEKDVYFGNIRYKLIYTDGEC